MFGLNGTGLLASTCFALALLVPTARAGSISIFSINTDTSSISGSGYIDLAFSYFVGAGNATATITAFSTDGALGGCGSGCTTDDASGELPGVVAISNGAPSGPLDDDYFEPITFGTYVAFQITLSGPALSGTGWLGSSTFALTYYDGNYNPLLSADPSGASARLTVTPSRTVAAESYADANGSFDTTIRSFDTTTGSVPEPSSGPVFGGGLLLLMTGIVPRRSWRRAVGLLYP